MPKQVGDSVFLWPGAGGAAGGSAQGPPKARLLQCSWAHGHRGVLLITDSHSERLWGGLRLCISYKLPGEADAMGSDHTSGSEAKTKYY